jgi:photosystem II stability/assembly factor-like uncharacterized protein
MDGHEMDKLVESFDGGVTWREVNWVPGMNANGGTSFTFFINTGNPATTRNTWLHLAQGGGAGTWRTTDAGANWTRVDNNEHPHGTAQIYQPDTGGVVYMAGAYSSHGWGVLRSTDYGQTWARVSPHTIQSTVWGTPNKVYSMMGIGGWGPDH